MKTDTINSCGKIKNSNGVKTIKKIATVVLAIVLTLTAVLVSPFGANKAKAAGEVLISIVPSVASVLPDGSFTVDIRVDPNGKNISLIQFDFEFDPSLVQVDEINPITWGPYPPVDDWSDPGIVDNVEGKITSIMVFPSGWDDDLGDFTFGLTPFTLATINMTAKSAVSGISYLRLPSDTIFYYDGASYTDNTLEAQSSGGTAFTILAGTDDFFYAGLEQKFDTISFSINGPFYGGTDYGEGITLSAEYYSTDWSSLIITDGTSNLSVSDGNITFTSPVDWTQTTVNGVTKYWVRLKTTTTPTNTPKARNIYTFGKTVEIVESATTDNLSYSVTAGSINVDITPPSLSTAKITGSNTVTLGYSEAVNTVIGDYTNLALTAGGARNVTGVSGSGTSIIALTFDGAAAALSETATMDIAATVVDLASNPLVAITGQAIADGQAPIISSITSNATSAGVLKIGDAINFTLTPGATEAGGSASGSYNGVALTWSTADSGATYTAAYTVAAGNTDRTSALQISGVILTDTAGNPSAAAAGTDVVKTIDANYPIISETTPVSTPTNDNTPDYTFTTNEAGAITYGVDCSSVTTSASIGTNTITFNALTDGAYSNCTITVTDVAGNPSNLLAVTEFTVSTASSAKNITSFNFTSPAVTGTVNNTAYTVALTVPYGTGVTALAPTIAVSTNAAINPASGAVQNFTNSVTYTVTAEDATTQAYLVTVTVAAAPPSPPSGGGGYTPPTSAVTNMSISINSGAATANNPAVTLTIGATNAAKMVISNSSDFSGATWETYAVSKAWTLTSGDGTKTVYIKFQDSAGIAAAVISDAIALDTSIIIPSYPDGALLKSASEEKVYVIKDGKKEWIETAADFIAGGYKWEDIKIISKEELDAIPNYGSGGGSSQTPNPPVNPTGYADGTLLKIADSFKVYVVIDQKKKWIATPEVFETLGYKWGSITVVSKADLDKVTDYEDNLIRAIGDYKVYLVVNGIKRHLPNPEIFLDYGFSWDDVKDVPQETINKYSRGYLVRESKQGTIYYLSPAGVKKWIPNPGIFASYNNKWEDIQVISKKEMDSYATSNLMKLIGSFDIYLLENNAKRLIPSAEIFNKNKYDWAKVLEVNKIEFDWYKTGAAVK